MVGRPRAVSNASNVSFLDNTARLGGPSFALGEEFGDSGEDDLGGGATTGRTTARGSGSRSGPWVTSARGAGSARGGRGEPLGGLTAAALREELQGDMKRAGLLAATRVAQQRARREEAIETMKKQAKEAKEAERGRILAGKKKKRGDDAANQAMRHLSDRSKEAAVAREDERLRKEAVEQAMASTEQRLQRDGSGMIVGLAALPEDAPEISLPSLLLAAAGSKRGGPASPSLSQPDVGSKPSLHAVSKGSS